MSFTSDSIPPHGPFRSRYQNQSCFQGISTSNHHHQLNNHRNTSIDWMGCPHIRNLHPNDHNSDTSEIVNRARSHYWLGDSAFCTFTICGKINQNKTTIARFIRFAPFISSRYFVWLKRLQPSNRQRLPCNGFPNHSKQ